MKFSKYNYIFESEKYGYLLYNAETNAFAELDKSLYFHLLAIKENSAIESIEEELEEVLVKAKILVSESDDSLFNNKKFRYYLQNFNSKSLGFALAPTTFCNFNCPYCYEENRKAIFMTEEIESNFFSFIKKHNTVKNINITWYGGEPLVGFKNIKNILSKIRIDDSIELGNHYMITNGYLLDEEKSVFFSNNPLNFMQITIDGNKESHDKRRVLTNGNPTYDVIISNIDTFLKYNKNTNIAIRVNIDSSNKSNFHQLYQELNKRWKGESVNVYPAFVKDYTDACATNCDVLNREERVEFYIELYEKYGLNIDFFPEFHVGGCGATNINYYVVGPRGELYKCWNDLGINERIVGRLDDDKVINYDILCQYIVGPTMFEDEKCLSCELFPVCDGGCKWLRLKNVYEGKNHDLCTNRKKHIDKFLELHYERRKKNKSQKL